MRKKKSTVGQPTDDKTAHAIYMLDNEGYKTHTQNVYYLLFSMATVVTLMRLNVT